LEALMGSAMVGSSPLVKTGMWWAMVEQERWCSFETNQYYEQMWGNWKQWHTWKWTKEQTKPNSLELLSTCKISSNRKKKYRWGQVNVAVQLDNDGAPLKQEEMLLKRGILALF
jgi:hypothetical protein